MDPFIIYLVLFSTIVFIGQLFNKSTVPISLILVIAGMLLSFVPFFPEVKLNPELVLDFFLPLLIYQIASFSSWRDMKRQLRPIALLSIGHVIFITLLVAVAMHTLIPSLGWPLAFVLGAIISPPDDVAIVSIAEKVRMPERVFIILEGEGMFNDAAALTLFRVALAATITNQFSTIPVITDFFAILIGETLYGIVLGNILGKIRERITNTSLHVIASFLTPFIAYLPAVKFGGTGVLATAIVGFIIGNQYTLRFTPEYRLIALSFWPMLAFAIESLLFLLIGLDLHSIFLRISSIPIHTLLLYIVSTTLVIIIGRFIWVYAAMIVLPRLLFPSLRKKDPYPPWQYPFMISWAGIRGGISLAAALAIPALTFKIHGVDPRDLITFIVFCIIVVTLVIQGLSIPWMLKAIGIDQIGKTERYKEHLNELEIRVQMTNAALAWLERYRDDIQEHKEQFLEVTQIMFEYRIIKKQFESRISDHDEHTPHNEQAEMLDTFSLLHQVIEVERGELARLWREDKINLRTRNKLVAMLDHQIQRHHV